MPRRLITGHPATCRDCGKRGVYIERGDPVPAVPLLIHSGTPELRRLKVRLCEDCGRAFDAAAPPFTGIAAHGSAGGASAPTSTA